MNNASQREPTKSFNKFSKKFLRTIKLQIMLNDLLIFTLKHKISKVSSITKSIQENNIKKEIKNIDKTLREHTKEIPLIFEMLFVEKVNAFLYYISDILLEIYCSKPELLNDKQIKFYEITQSHNITEIIRNYAERVVYNKMHDPFNNIVQTFVNTFKIQICQDKSQQKSISNTIETRNLLVHNNGIINSKFLKKTKFKLTRGKKIKITKDHFKKVDDILFGAALRTDTQAVRTFFS